MKTENKNQRGFWGSRMGFILAASGSAVGLGNIWKFPYIVGQNGGGAFVLIYLICIFVIGTPIMLAEFTLGRKTNLNPVGAFDQLKPKSPWTGIGYMGVLAGFFILSFYGVVGGWTFAYVVKSITGSVLAFPSPKEAGDFFGNFIGNTGEVLFYHALFMGTCIAIVLRGVHGGIERACDILMPTLVVILFLLMIRSLTLDGAMEGVAFYLTPDFGKINTNVILIALGQAFFSLSLGMGCMITYGSYLSEKENLTSCTVYVVMFDTLIALLVGMVMFSVFYLRCLLICLWVMAWQSFFSSFWPLPPSLQAFPYWKWSWPTSSTNVDGNEKKPCLLSVPPFLPLAFPAACRSGSLQT